MINDKIVYVNIKEILDIVKGELITDLNKRPRPTEYEKGWNAAMLFLLEELEEL